MRRSQRTREHRKTTALALRTPPYGLLVRLNDADLGTQAQELVALVRTLQKIERVEAALTEAERQLSQIPNYESSGPARAPSWLYVKANEILSAYHWSPRVTPPPHDLNSFAWNARTAQSDWKNMFVHWLLNLRAERQLFLLRSCPNCEKWFYAATHHQHYCKRHCRQQFHSRDRVFKEKRRVYMRRYREDQKSQDVKMLKQAQSKLGDRTLRSA